MITVFTPTYNRRDTLKRLYESLVRQGDAELTWLVIDDGSTDNTKDIIDGFKKEKKIKIIYIYKENGGKMSAVNLAHEKCQTEYMITIDSDDMMADNFIKQAKDDLLMIDKVDEIAGIVYLTARQSKHDEIVGTRLPDDGTICKFYELYRKYYCTGDKCAIWKTKVLKKYAFPIIEGERFVPDAYLMNQISKKYDIMTMNRIGTIIEYREDGYSDDYFNLVKKNPKGTRLYYRELYGIEKSLYNIYAYVLFSIYAKIGLSVMVREHSAKIRVLLLYIPVWVIARIRR